LALRRGFELIGPDVRVPEEVQHEIEQLSGVEQLMLETGVSMDTEVEKLSSMNDVSFDVGIFRS